jgi:site-specific DNA-methyltransferase (adenine-specific)
MVTLLPGDCVGHLQALPSESIDSFVTDPPYGIELRLKAGRTRPAMILGDGRLEAVKLWRRWLPEAARVAMPNTMHFVFGSWKSIWMKSVLEDHFRVVDCMVWDKKCPSMLGYYFRPQWELIWVCVKGKVDRPRPMPRNLVQICRVLKPSHPCEKPVPLLRHLIRMACPAGGMIADPFAGIASTAVAAIEEGRSFWGCELDRQFLPTARRRIADAQRRIHS